MRQLGNLLLFSWVKAFRRLATGWTNKLIPTVYHHYFYNHWKFWGHFTVVPLKLIKHFVVFAGAVLRWGRGHLPPSQIQKLADHSDVISKVPKCSKIPIFRGSAPNPAGGAYSSPPSLLSDGTGLVAPANNPTPAVSPCVYGSQSPTHCRVGNLLMIDFKCRPTGVPKKWHPCQLHQYNVI